MAIDRLVLEGLGEGAPCEGADTRWAIQQTIEAELGRRLSTQPIAEPPLTSTAVARLDGGTLRVATHRNTSHQIGAQIARTVQQGMYHGSKNSNPTR